MSSDSWRTEPAAYDVESVAEIGEIVSRTWPTAEGRLEELRPDGSRRCSGGAWCPRPFCYRGAGTTWPETSSGRCSITQGWQHWASHQQVVAGALLISCVRARLCSLILSAVTEVCGQRVGRSLPILVHWYGSPVPDGRGFLRGWLFLPGPWLEPGAPAEGSRIFRSGSSDQAAHRPLQRPGEGGRGARRVSAREVRQHPRNALHRR